MKLPGTSLIATVYNEAATIRNWLAALAAQSSWPEEFVIVDGASKDDTASIIASHVWPAGFPVPKVIVQKCNIAGGRNIAIQNCRAEIIASTDAGSMPDPHWFEEIVKPLMERPEIDVVAGECPTLERNSFQRRMTPYLQRAPTVTSENCAPSSRNTAFRRTAWAGVGGYPEWLTLTAEDSLFNNELRLAGFRFYYQPAALVSWENRPDLKSYLKMMYLYGYGSAEARQGLKHYVRYLWTTFVPPLILFTPHPLADAPLRYARNAAAAFGWLAGKIKGRKPPAGWKYMGGVWASPEAQAHRAAVASKAK